MSLDFCAFDFETGDFHHATAVQIGIVRVRSGQMVDQYETLILPEPDFRYIAPHAQKLHGITLPMIANAPSWAEIFPAIQQFIGGDILVAHNADFDGRVLSTMCHMSKLSQPTWALGDTLTWAQSLLDLENYKLPTVAHALQIPFKETHQGLADATACAAIAIALANRQNASDITQLAIDAGPLFSLPSPSKNKITRKRSNTVSQETVETTVNRVLSEQQFGLDQIAGETVVFTGDMSIRRDDAIALAEANGAKTMKSFGKRATVLVVGQLEAETLRNGAAMSRKLSAAVERQQNGDAVYIITEDVFFSLCTQTAKPVEDTHPSIAPGVDTSAPTIPPPSAPPVAAPTPIPAQPLPPSDEPVGFGNMWTDWRQKRNTYAAFAMRVFIKSMIAGALISSCMYPFLDR